VADEINRHGERDVTAQALAATDWIDIVDALPIPALIRAWDLGDGESSVLAWGRAHAETELIIDDLAARRCAAALGIPVRGTLGLVLVAKRRGRVASARSTLDQLRIAGMYLADDVLNAALRLVGE
jgi:predicted nucleic acid-binding protein